MLFLIVSGKYVGCKSALYKASVCSKFSHPTLPNVPSLTYRRPSWSPRRARPWHSGSPRPAPWCSACWGPGSAASAQRCSRGWLAAGWWSVAASCPRWSRSWPGRSPASGRTTSTGRVSPWRLDVGPPWFWCAPIRRPKALPCSQREQSVHEQVVLVSSASPAWLLSLVHSHTNIPLPATGGERSN